jgi:LemA protein
MDCVLPAGAIVLRLGRDMTLSKTLKLYVFLLGAAFVSTVAGCQNYDVLVEKDQVCQQKWGDLDATLQRRADLVPNLVATVKGSAKHEEETLARVAQARASATSIQLSADDLEDPAKVAAFQKAQDDLHGALSRLLAIQESYPDLKANASFHDLQVQLEGTENRILRAREEYNNAVRDYNTELGKIRGQVVNKVTGRTFKPRAYFQATAAAQAVPAVSF